MKRRLKSQYNLKPLEKKEKVICAMSGGVDSSVAAALLKEAGDFEVIGVFMKFWSGSSKNSSLKTWNRCCSLEAEKRARLIASKLGIPFYVLRLEKEFKKKIVDYFLKEYKAGRTPNPCVICNKEIKFGLLLKKALALDTNFIATGHYACLKGGRQGIKLIKSKDRNKDQSYFLWKLNQKQLNYILFPVGGYTKTEVKKMAVKFKLPVFNVPESQEVCFVKTTTNDFLKQHLKTKPGKIIDNKGKVIGKHEGLWFYTIGQRKRIRLPGGPFYVLDKDLKKNVLIVTKNEKDIYKKELVFKDVNWISGTPLNLPIKVKVKIRYRHRSCEGVVSRIKGARYRVWFKKPQRAVTPGQSAVFYKNTEVLGGGVISFN